MTGDFLPLDQGWMSLQELQTLKELATAPTRTRGGILELGTFKGLSLSALRFGGPVLSVDNFTLEERSLEAWLKNVRSLGLKLGRDVVLWTMDTEEACRLLAAAYEPFRLVLVDACHDGEHPRTDIAYAMALAAHGTVVVDDYTDTFPAVKAAVDELVPPHVRHQVGKLVWWRQP